MPIPPSNRSPLVRLATVLSRVVLAVGSFLLALLLAESLVQRRDPFGASYYRDASRYLAESI